MSDVQSKISIAKGLDAIFSVHEKHESVVSSDLSIKKILVTEIQPSPFQARKDFSQISLLELSSSIKQHGILQPLIVRKNNNGVYELLAGERRLRAANQLKMVSVPVIECAVDDSTAMAFGLIENIQRQNLNAIEEGQAYQRLLNEFQLSHDLLAEKVGKSRSHITNMLRLTRLAEHIKNHLIRDEISMGHARAILPLSENKQSYVVERIIQAELSVRETEILVKKILENPNDKHQSQNSFILPEKVKREIHIWKAQLQKKYIADIKISFDRQGRARLALEVESADKLSLLIDQLI